MLFTTKHKGFFIEQDEHVVRIACTSATDGPIIVEQARELPAGDDAALTALARELVGKTKGPYIQGNIGVYPPRRVIRKASLDLKRIKEPAYFGEVLTTQFRIEPDKHTLAILNTMDGTDYDIAKAVQKEALFCGGPTEELFALQDRFLELGIYPLKMELGTVSFLGALLSYLAFKQSKTPTLVLEIGKDATQSFIVGANGVEVTRYIPFGIGSMIPVVQKELGLKDEEAAQKLFFSNAFDFTSMGTKLAGRLLKELQSSIGFFEVQTGQSIGQVLCTHLSSNLNWIRTTMAGALGVPSLEVDLVSWLESHQIKLAEAAAPFARDPRWFGLFGLMTHYDALLADKKA